MNFIHAHLYVKQYVENNVRQCEEQDTEVERLVQFGYLDNNANSDAIRQKSNARYNQSTDVEENYWNIIGLMRQDPGSQIKTGGHNLLA